MKLAIISLLALFVLAFSILATAQSVDFTPSPPLIKTVTLPHQNTTASLVINGDSLQQTPISVNYAPLNSFFIPLEDETFIGSTLSLSLNPDNNPPGVYAGHIVLSSQQTTLSVPVILEIESQPALFDVFSELSLNSLDPSPGQNIDVEVRILNLGSLSSRTNLTFNLLDLHNNILFSSSKPLSVEQQTSFTEQITIPKNLTPGDYVLAAIIQQNNSIGTDSLLLNIKQQQFSLLPLFFVLILFIVMFAIFYFRTHLFNYWKKESYWRNQEHKTKRIVKRAAHASNTRFILLQIDKLKYKKALLKKAYSNKYIREKTYRKGVSQINQTISALQKKLL